ncbi:MAG TPA: ribonuclease Y [Thermoleophilaceae bacterium]|nr:ribonuclease Y [Thermoleophilaceae bacterium]
MEYVLAAVVAAVVAGAVVVLGQRSGRGEVAVRREDRTPQGSAGTSSGPDVPERGAGSVPPVAAPAPDGGAGASSASLVAEGASATVAESVSREAEPVSGALGEDGGAPRPPGRPDAPDGSSSRNGPAPSPAGAATADGLALELRERRAEIARTEERLLTKESNLDARLSELERRERSLEDRARNLTRDADSLKSARREHVRELERIAGLSTGQARQLLLREVEGEVQHERARLIRQAEEQARQDADRRARNILATCMQRVAGGHAAETTVSVVPLDSDELKGRVIGREGRNIRALETLTGIDFIIDDTPGVVALSGFDGVRREVARVTLEKLLQDGRIHPARIEEAYREARSEIEDRMYEAGEEAVYEAGIGSLDPELTKVLGRLRYRTSYGQNVLAHSIECAHLAALISHELGASAKTARRAALLHDIGKAVSHEVEGPHALVGGQLARRHGEAEAVAHAMEAHHNEVDIQTIEAVVVQVADALSGARPGARGESLEHYTKRLHELEEVAGRRGGVERVYAMQAGREVRVIVRPEDLDDDAAAILSHEIARDVERELEYPGQIRVTVIRESRSVGYAK